MTLCLAFGFLATGYAQGLSADVRAAVGDALNALAREESLAIGRIRIDSVSVRKNLLQLFANEACASIPFREDNVKEVYRRVRDLLPSKYAGHRLQLWTQGRRVEELIPLNFRGKPDRKTKRFAPEAGKPLVTPLAALHTPTAGLKGRHIALWPSHGFYYESKLTRWEWQRARIFQTVEDLYTAGYVLPFLAPMLENAGAHVLLPRERDVRREEVIVDNDTCLHGNSRYAEHNGGRRWSRGAGYGFAHLRERYVDGENPFREGTYRMVETVKTGKESTAEWLPDIPVAGEYAVYVSYRTVANSTDDALYTVHHRGGTSSFRVNQRMGGGTWIYLGTFPFSSGSRASEKIVLSNRSAGAGRILTADAVKIGGGMGNVARRISAEGATENVKSSDASAPEVRKNIPAANYPYELSGYPRFCEAARYWLQWAGIPDSIYSESRGKNDYTDDYKSRGAWVNYLAGGSSVHPGGEGLNIPVDLAFAFHTDAGTTLTDSLIGTLGIYQTAAYDGKFANGASRYLSRDLTDLIQSQIVHDVRALHEPEWTRRGMWNRSYFEARVPRVPTMLLELLSHQNFADMRYGLDPRFRFTVSRAIYKGMLRFISDQRHTPYVVQPLPVEAMALRRVDGERVELTWQPVNDPLEPTARPDKYIVYTRMGDGEFDRGVLVSHNSYRTSLPEGVVCSYKVTAVNKGGESFPSEILSAGRVAGERGTVLVVNGFDRVSAPFDFKAPTPVDTLLAGFLDEIDHGVPYVKDLSYVGKMKEFRRTVPWTDDDASGFGDSYANYETKVIAGNTFDYPATHGEAILKAGYSFVSCSDEAVERGTVRLGDYRHADLILGKEYTTKMGREGTKPLAFKTFGKKMQEAVAAYCASGGNLFVSGAYVGSDLWDNRYAPSEEDDCRFATQVLKYKWRAGRAAAEGKVKSVASPFAAFTGNYTFHNTLNEESYAVESPDAIEPATEGAYTIMRYSENNLSAGVAYAGAYKTCVLGFPFESLRTAAEREALMKAILEFFNPRFSNIPLSQ